MEFASWYITDKLAAMLLTQLTETKLSMLVTMMENPAAGSLAGSLFEACMHAEWTRTPVDGVFLLQAREGTRMRLKTHSFNVIGSNLEWEANVDQDMVPGMAFAELL